MELGGTVQEKGEKERDSSYTRLGERVQGRRGKELPTLPPCTRRWQLPSKSASALFDLPLNGKSTATSGKIVVAAPSIQQEVSRSSSNTISFHLPDSFREVPRK
ncbi:unnamed protein product, partial [Rangifer tarandus platyrhynchus]